MTILSQGIPLMSFGASNDAFSVRRTTKGWTVSSYKNGWHKTERLRVATCCVGI